MVHYARLPNKLDECAFLSATMSLRKSFQIRQNRARSYAIKAWCAKWEHRASRLHTEHRKA